MPSPQVLKRNAIFIVVFSFAIADLSRTFYRKSAEFNLHFPLSNIKFSIVILLLLSFLSMRSFRTLVLLTVQIPELHSMF